MTKDPDHRKPDRNDEPPAPGGHAAERLREFLRQRRPAEVETDETEDKDGRKREPGPSDEKKAPDH